MVLAKPYKVLSSFVFDWSFAPLKSRQLDLYEALSPKPTSKKIITKKGILKPRTADDVLTEEHKKEFVYPSHRFLLHYSLIFGLQIFNKKFV